MTSVRSLRMLRGMMREERGVMMMSDWSRTLSTPLDTVINNNINNINNMTSPSMNLVPIVIEQTGRGERSYDIYSRLLKVISIQSYHNDK